MIPIQQLLSRIRWDQEFGRGQFVIGYQDRFSSDVHYLPLSALGEPGAGGHAFEIVNESGDVITIPYHRVVEVKKDGEIIWQRKKEG